MKKDLHPNVQEVTVTCTGCGTEFTSLSTNKEIKVSICSECHPFFTGTNKLVDTEGRIEKFRRRQANAKAKQAAK